MTPSIPRESDPCRADNLVSVSTGCYLANQTCERGLIMTAAETYAAMVDVAKDQRIRLHGEEMPGARWDREVAQRFRYDPHRSLDASLDIIASYVEPQDVLIDVGGGAGRICLPMALRCREAIVVDVSQAMEGAFQECAVGR